MFRRLLSRRKLLILFLLALAIRLFALFPQQVERYYSSGFYPQFSLLLRRLFGWLPFSIGDCLYFAAGLWLVAVVWRLIRRWRKGLLNKPAWLSYGRRSVEVLLTIYIVFNLFWGLNYNRPGIRQQLQLAPAPYTMQDLQALTLLLKEKLEQLSPLVDSLKRDQWLDNQLLFQQGLSDYARAEQTYPFLRYRIPSIKASLYGEAGKYIGYTGYYNPFSGEAQLKTSIPVFMRAFVVNHEIAHQLGYAREDEASFVSYLVSRRSASIDVQYSLYYELFFTALYQLYSKENRPYMMKLFLSMPQRVINDRMEEKRYHARNKNFMAPYMTEAYDRYLKLNNQPSGKATYNEVIALVMAYIRQHGKNSL